MYRLFFCISLKNSIFCEFSNIYLLSAQNRVKWRHKIRPIAKKILPILIFFARDDAKLMPGEVCQVSCRYSNKWRSYSRKTEGGSDPTPPPPRRWRVKNYVRYRDQTFSTLSDINVTPCLKILSNLVGKFLRKWRFSDVMSCDFELKMVVSYIDLRLMYAEANRKKRCQNKGNWILYKMAISDFQNFWIFTPKFQKTSFLEKVL